MTPFRRKLGRVARGTGRGLVYLVALLLVIAGVALGAIETAWGKNQIRGLIVGQANRYLTATLEIDRIEGSLLRGIELVGIRLSREGHPLIGIDRVSLSYSLRELFDRGTVIRSLRLERPHVVAAKLADGRWDLAALVRREARQQQRTGPGRPIQLQSIVVVDATIELRDPWTFGPAHVPTRFEQLNTSLSFAYEPVRWRVDLERLSWRGSAPDLTVSNIGGSVSNGNEGLSFYNFSVDTPHSAFALNGRIVRSQSPTTVDLKVAASRFAFQEWAGILTGLKNIAVDGSFDAQLTGPLSALNTDLRLTSTGGNVRGPFVLDTTVPGWLGRGSVELERFDLARWLNRPDRPSDITGRVDFDLALQLGRVPRGTYAFDGAHAEYLGYEGNHVRAQGTVDPDKVLIHSAAAAAYGANVRLSSGRIVLAEPYRFHFQGAATNVDLRLIPESVPVPHVESTLAFQYDVEGQFSQPFIAGRAEFEPSEFLGAAIGAGTSGSIDSRSPIHYAGEGDVSRLDIHRFGEGLQVGWMLDPRYAGTLAGHFHAEGAGNDRRTMTLTGGGRLTRGEFFEGNLSDAMVAVEIGEGTLRASYDGRLDRVNPAIPMGDRRYAAALTGTGRARFRVEDLLVETPALDDYFIEAELLVDGSRVHGIPVERGAVTATLSDSSLNVAALEIAGEPISGRGAGVLELDGQRSSRFDYTIDHADLAKLEDLLGRQVPGELVTTGQLTGPFERLRLAGKGTINRLAASGVSALTTTATYDVTIPPEGPARATARVEGNATFVQLFDQSLQQVNGVVTYDNERVGVDLELEQSEAVKGRIKADLLLHSDRRSLDLSSGTVELQNSAWRLVTPPAPTIRWDDGGIAISPMTLTAADDPNQRINMEGTWRDNGGGSLHVTASHVFLDNLTAVKPAPYGGVIDLDATIRGTRQRPLVSADLNVTNGRVRQVSYQRLSGHVDYADEIATVDLRLDQAPGVFLTAAGTVPLGLIERERSELPINLKIASSSISLGLVEGLTGVVRNVTGDMKLNLTVVGTGQDPHFTGTVDLSNAAFLVVSSGARYKNGRALLQFAADRVSVEAFRLEDNRGRPLEVRGSLGTHELRVGELEIDITSKGFEVLHNEFGTVDVNADLRLRGQFESPRIEGRLTIAGGEVKVDEILDRSLFRPYAMQAAVPAAIDAVAALNPWQRLGLNIELHVPGTLRMTGQEVQVNSTSPIGLGSINIRAIGDLYLFKESGQQFYVTGSFDSLTGTYSFQGRRFDIDPTSSINFRGDLNPEVYVTVNRVISGVETRVTISGPLNEPELRLASSPPLEQSDILSLIVFNTSANDLNAQQQRDLAIRAGALAAGFIATPLVTAVQRSLGLDILEIEAPQDATGGARVTIGDELFPGLVARFSRQFGPNEYDEATIEYQLSRILRVRATFSDVQTLTAVSSFRRAERAGIDLILFFSF